MEKRYLDNPFPESATPRINEEHVKNLICNYVDEILENTSPNSSNEDTRGDLYVGNAGIAFMFWKLNNTESTKDLYPALDHALTYIRNAKANASRYKKRSDERVGFLSGNAGIYAVSAAISQALNMKDTLEDDLKNFESGFEPCMNIAFSETGCDEILVGRAGYLRGCYWLNDIINTRPISDEKILQICEVTVQSGRMYAQTSKAPLPLMYQYHGTEYLGAAHGLCAILHSLLDSPWFEMDSNISKTKYAAIKGSIDFYLSLQDAEGNFPVALEDLRSGREKRLVHWCHGAPGAIYLLAKSYLVYNDQKYLDAAKKSAELVWKKGLLKKGPGICHGVAGNGYVFLILYRLTGDDKYLYRAGKFMEFLTNSEFKLRARVPDRPFSLYEGVAGTVCFLIDLLEPSTASYPFMDIFH